MYYAMQEHWREHGPPEHITLAAAYSTDGKGKKGAPKGEPQKPVETWDDSGYGDLEDLAKQLGASPEKPKAAF